MYYNIETALRNTVVSVYSDLEAAAYEMGEDGVDWEALADYLADAMHWGDCATEWTALDYDVRRTLAEKVAKEYA